MPIEGYTSEVMITLPEAEVKRLQGLAELILSLNADEGLSANGLAVLQHIARTK